MQLYKKKKKKKKKNLKWKIVEEIVCVSCYLQRMKMSVLEHYDVIRHDIAVYRNTGYNKGEMDGDVKTMLLHYIA
jgi:hypothetical protein